MNAGPGLIALVGRQDEPTDALRDYCLWLGEALARRGVAVGTAEVRWDLQGRVTSLARLWKRSADWRGRWVLLQYTALMWSRRGFPLMVPLILLLLRLRGCRVGIVLHDPCPRAGARYIDRFRVRTQLWILRAAQKRAERVLVTIPKSELYWLLKPAPNVYFVPVGANIPARTDMRNVGGMVSPKMPTVGVFGVSTWHAARRQEAEAICHAMRAASAELGKLGLLVIGRGALEAEADLREGLSGSAVELKVEGVLTSEQISARLSSCDVFLFVRGPFSSRRGSGLAAMACGLPMVAYEGFETGPPLTEAGIVFVPRDNLRVLAMELTALLRDEQRRQSLANRNLLVFQEKFSWDRIADSLMGALTSADRSKPAGSVLVGSAPGRGGGRPDTTCGS